MSSLLRVIFDPDTTPPGVPTLGTPTVVGQTRIDLSWTAVTDTGGSGLAGYNVEIDGTTVVQTGVQTTYSATGFTAATTHTFRVRSRDGNGNLSNYSNQVSATTQAVPVAYNPPYPRFGSYSLGGTQNPSDAALAACHVNIIITYPGWEQSKGVNWAAKCASINSLSTIGTLTFPYTILPDLLKVAMTAPQAFWEVGQILQTNGLWTYRNGVAETNQISSDNASYWKANYTLSGKQVGGLPGERYYQTKLRWDYKLNVTGGTFSTGSANVNVTANPTGFAGTFLDNYFASERTSADGAGITGDYDRDGTQDVLSSASSRALIQSSNAAAADFYRTLKSDALVLGNSADWPIWYPGGIAGLPIDQTLDGGVLEHIQEWTNGVRGTTGAQLMNAIKVQMDGYRGSKLGVLSVLISSATAYAELRYWHCVACLTSTYYYPHLTTGLLAQELGTLAYDERNFSLGAALTDSTGAPQWTARYQAGANGAGIYRRDFANGIALWAAPGATYASQALGGTFYRLNGTLDPATNNAATVTSVTMTAGTGLVLSRTPTASTSGFTPASSAFTVQAPSGIGHDLPLVITRTSGSWASRTYGTGKPWLYDTGAVAYQDGVAKTPMAPYANGQQMAETVSGGVWARYGQDPNTSVPLGANLRLARSSGSRSAPNPNTAAWWYSTTGNAAMKCEMMEPFWPPAWGGSSPVNQSIYVSYWIRLKNINQCIGNGKYGRFNDGGVNFFYPGGSNTAVGNMEATGPMPSESTWYRIEYYLDYALDVLDIYGGYRYQRQVNLGDTTPGPREWRKTTPYNAVSNRGGYLYTAGANNTPMTIGPYAQALIGAIGFDGQLNQPFTGVEMDIANFYVDPHWERFEISDSPTWSLAPPTTFGSPIPVGTPREVQGRWSRDSATQATVYLNKGQFSSLTGKYLWYVDDFKTATLIGQFT